MGFLLPAADAPPDVPEVIFHHGVVVTMDRDRPRAEAVAVRDGRILAVGGDDEVLRMKGRSTRLVDLAGRALLPGFIDAHAHWIGDAARMGHTPDTAVEAALRAGWTSITEQYVDERRLEELRALDAAGRLRVRVNAYLPVNFTDEKDTSWYLRFTPHQVLGPRLRLAGVKFFLDHEWGTEVHWEQPGLDAAILTAHRHGWQVSAHAVSAEAHGQLLTAVARAMVAAPRPDPRHRVEHVIQLRDDQLVRLRELGMVASIQPGLPGDQAEVAGFPELVARGETRWIARWRDLVDGGVRTVGSTDMPWLVLDLVGSPTTPPHGSALEAVYQAVTRESYAGRPPEAWQRAQRLTVEQGLRLFTADAASATFEEDVKGTVSVGKAADLVVLTTDPTAVAVDALLDVRVVMTVVGGRVEFCAGGPLC